MGKQATTTFDTKSWDEKTYDEFGGGRKLTRTNATFSYSGDLEGEGKIEYLMVYNADGTGNAIGLERVVGKVGGRAGSFVMQHNDTFEASGVKVNWFVVVGSGTGDLQSLSGNGEFLLAGHGPYTGTFNYELK